MNTISSSAPHRSRAMLRYRLHLRSHLVRVFFFLSALLVALILGMPLLYLIASSFKPATEVYRIPPTFFPSRWTLQGYRELLNLSNIVVAFRNSVIVATLAASLGVALSVGLCYTLTRFQLPGMHFFTYLILFVYILPGILLMIPMYTVAARMGLTQGLLPLALIHVSFTLPFAIWMMRSYFAGIPTELEDAALVDGATRAQAFLQVILPLARPGIIATFIFTFILSWNEVLFASIFATSLKHMVISTTLAHLLQETSGWLSWGMVNAAGVIATVPALVFCAFIQRQLVTGFMAGAIKG